MKKPIKVNLLLMEPPVRVATKWPVKKGCPHEWVDITLMGDKNHKFLCTYCNEIKEEKRNGNKTRKDRT